MSAAHPTIEDLRSQLGGQPRKTTNAYAAKMLHRVPDAPVVEREQFILDHCVGKRVLEFGASGPLHDAIVKVAASVLGVDRQSDGDKVIAFDLDDVTEPVLPGGDFPEVIVCGEILEHLGNPQWFLTRLRRQFGATKTIITVPNAFSDVARARIVTGVENVNVDHCCWYSYRTLKTLLGRAGYAAFGFAWYRGKPLTSEGLVIVCEG